MRHLITFIFISIILTSCNSNTAPMDKSKTNKTIDAQTNFKSIINGDWVESSYIADISKTKSPLKSQNALNSIVEINIDISKIKGDSLEVGSPSIHEGGSFVVYFRPGITVNSLQTNIIDYNNETIFSELGYSITNIDTTLVIYSYDKNKKLLGKRNYRKVPKNSGGALQYMVNKTLITGLYTTNDVTGKPITVQFTNDGRIKGLSNYTNYKVWTDFVAPGPDDDPTDGICFDSNSNSETCFLFEIKTDTLLLTQGQLKYTLVRQ